MSPSRITKTQRWLDLIAHLAVRRFAVPLAELMELPAYAAMAPASARRVFERDKTELRAQGVPLETVRCSAGGNEIGDGYLLAPGDFYLPYLKIVSGRAPTARAGRAVPGNVELTAEDAADALEALTRVARMPASPLLAEARRAHAKLALDLDPASFPGAPVVCAEPPGSEALRPVLRRLTDAVLARQGVRFRYHGMYRGDDAVRSVRPYGLVRTGGNWYLVGHDEDRGAVREFRVGRMEELAAHGAAGAFEVPADFRLAEHLGREAWELGDEAEAEVDARFAFPLSLWAERNGRGELLLRDGDGAQVRRFRVRQAGPFLRWLLSLGEGAEILRPLELRREGAELARRTLARYRGAGRDG